MSIECISHNTINILSFIHYPSRFVLFFIIFNRMREFFFLSCRLLDLSLVWFKQHSSTNENKVSSEETDTANLPKTSETGDIFRDGCKTIMSILVILTNDCGKKIL